MTTLSNNNKIGFYKFLNGDKTVSELESFIYGQTDLEHQLTSDIYIELISFDFKDKYVIAKLPDFIKQKLIDEGQFETWKLRTILNNFLTDYKNLRIYLDKLYHSYFGVYQDNGKRKYEFKFLANLGLNYLWWVDEAYLKTTYGENWKIEYDKCFDNFEFYQQQLKPFADQILTALHTKQIIILNDGTYNISDELKADLETDKIYELKHPDKKYSR